MANPFEVTPPNALQALLMGVQGYDRSQKMAKERQLEEARLAAGQVLQSGGDTRAALARLFMGGDVQGANALANYGNQTADQAYKTGMLEVARQTANRQETPAPLKLLEAAGIDPRSPAGQKALFPKTDTPISATDKKAIFEAEDANVPLQSTLETLKRAKELAPKAYSGYTAGIRGSVGANLPDLLVPDAIADPNTSKATVELNQILSGEAIKNMAETLKGATTNEEMNRFTAILADPKAPPELKIRTIERMEKLAQRKFDLNQQRIKSLRGGDYFKPESGQPGRITSRAEYDALAPGTPYIAPDGSQRIKR